MYTPKFFAETDTAKLIAFMREFNFATLVTAEDDRPIATHLPFIIEENEGRIVLSAHMAKANDQWKQLGPADVLVIFAEPHAYISPLLYVEEVNVPTWNYVAVHVYGQAHMFTAVEENLALLEKQIAVFDPEFFNTNWKKIPQEYKASRAAAITAFEIDVTDIQGKKKLNQNKPNDAQNVIDALGKSENKNEQQIARFMKEVHEKE